MQAGTGVARSIAYTLRSRPIGSHYAEPLGGFLRNQTLPVNSTREIQFRSLWTIVNGRHIHARTALHEAPENAPAAVLVHGLVVSSDYMLPLARLLASDYRVFAPDLPGFGLSDKPQSALTIRELADALAEWMDSVGLSRPLLISNSFGCQVVVDLLAREPGRARCSVLLGPTVDPRRRTMVQQAISWIRNAFYEPPSLGVIVVRNLLRAGVIRSFQSFRYLVQDPIETKLPTVTTPTLVARGSRDPVVPERWTKEMARCLPDACIATIPNAGHTLNYNAPSAAARLVRGFDATHDSA